MRNIVNKLALVFISLLAYTSLALAQQTPKVLIVTAHPDDESAFAATVYKITHDLKGKVDIVIVTNGEGGYKYSTLAEDLYGIELTEEKIGREHLPTIRKREMMNGGRIIGLRSYYFLEQKDHRYTQDVKEVFDGIWNLDLVRNRVKDIVVQGEYDFIFTLLPTAETHGHHKGATILALEVVSSLSTAKKPIILGCTVLRKEDAEKFTFTGLEGFSLTKIKKESPLFTFDRTSRFGFNNNLNYKIIVNWLISEHKSQGATQLGVNQGDLERFWYFDINSNSGIEATQNLFKQLEINNFKVKEYK
ncbi:MAG: PIG-L family deacetylase [Blastocatellia bacterium]|nr:PIG-L family deacetylase [Blastocatellia bacterium]